MINRKTNDDPRSDLHFLRLLSLICVLVTAGPSYLAVAEDGLDVDFAQDVFPLLRRACWECHGATKQEGGLRLDEKTEVLGSAAIQPGDANESELVRRIELPRGHDEVMPAIGEPLSINEVSIIRRWIDAGAPWPDNFLPTPHWAYIVPQRPEVPQVSAPQWPTSPLDHFVMHKLEQLSLSPSPMADPAILLRRVYLDLVGLPPTLREVRQFERDPSSLALQRVVDDLMTRPQFGERWARHWLDLARYADSHGFQRDDLIDIWAYRDWVIAAFNEDMPFDQFTIEQLAGDLLPAATESQRVATGFHRCAPTNVEAGSLPEETRIAQVIDRVNTTASVWLGSTLECAQCHDHKYDPFTAKDYYQLFAFFNSTEIEADRTNPSQASSIAFKGPTLPLHDPERARLRTTLAKHLAELEAARSTLVSDDQASDDESIKTIDQAIADSQGEIRALAPNTTLVMVELKQKRPTFVFDRGDYRQPGELVIPGTPSALHRIVTEQATAESADAERYDRLTLARWLVDPANPLVARVMVNRLWAELFGAGIVETAEDFGIKGDLPSHPELLDYLAVEFRSNHGSIKHLLKTIILSSTYQQSSVVSPDLAAIDPSNRWLARGPRFRMDAEMIRDNALAIADLINLKPGGPPVRPYQPAGLWTKVGGMKYDYEVSPGDEKYRRGVYVIKKRGAPYPSFINFDATSRLTCTIQRSRSNTPLQALTLLNDPVHVEAAKAIAVRAIQSAGTQAISSVIQDEFQRCLSRKPTALELQTLEALFQQQRDHSRTNLADAKKLAKGSSGIAASQSADFSAWYSVATVLLNLHETITKP